MKTTSKVYTLSETAAILQAKLGNIRSWPSFLHDCCRGKGGPGILKGLELLPSGYERTGLKRPQFAPDDIARFIHAVWKAVPASRGPHEMGRYVTADLSDGRHWTMRPLFRAIGLHR